MFKSSLILAVDSLVGPGGKVGKVTRSLGQGPRNIKDPGEGSQPEHDPKQVAYPNSPGSSQEMVCGSLTWRNSGIISGLSQGNPMRWLTEPLRS